MSDEPPQPARPLKPPVTLSGSGFRTLWGGTFQAVDAVGIGAGIDPRPAAR
jgi:hypothetical protein